MAKQIKETDFKEFHPRIVMAYENGVTLLIELDFMIQKYIYIIKDSELEKIYTDLSKAIDVFNKLVLDKEIKND